MVSEKNKQIVYKFNKEYIEKGDISVFKNLISIDFVNHNSISEHTAGPDSLLYYVLDVFKKGFTEIFVEINSQISEGDIVITNKKIKLTSKKDVFGIPPTKQESEFNIIDMTKLKDEKIIEYWEICKF